MINTAGAYILILIFAGYNKGGLAMHEFPNRESCQSAVQQVRLIDGLRGYCIAMETIDE